MSSELSLVTVGPNRINVQKHKSRQPSISTDRLLESLREERFSSNQKAAKEFIEQTLDSKLCRNDLHEALKDGVLLCSLMNRLQPNVIPQISRKDLPFVKMENINNFLNAASQFGLHSSELFDTVDLFEGKHMERVIATILAIARIVEKRHVRHDSNVSNRRCKSKDSPTKETENFKDLNAIENEDPNDLDKKELENFDDLEIKKSDLVNVRELEGLSVKEKLDSIKNNDNDYIKKKNERDPEKTLVDIEIFHDKKESNVSGVSLNKRPSLRKSITMGQIFTKTERETGEDLAPLPISPIEAKAEKSRSNRKTHVRYNSDINIEMSSNKNDKMSGYGGDFKRRESICGTKDVPREKLVLRNGEEVIAQYQLGNCIGKGQFGAVYRALHLGTGQMVAVKRIKLEGRTSDEIEQLMHEVELLKSLSHPSVVKYEAFIMTDDHINIILEYVENGSLLHTLKSFGNFPEKLVASYVVKILEGLVYLHIKQVVHCDLKAANILTTKNGNVKLSDFGVSLNLKMMENVSTEVAGTPNWMAPEVIELKGASTASDIWSLGCTIIELLTGKPPYSDLLAMTALFRIVEDDCPPLPENISDDLTDFLKQCFHKKSSMRPTARELFRHNWIKNNWSLKELRSQESLPFLRRITSDTKIYEMNPNNGININKNIKNSNGKSPIEPESKTPPASKTPIDPPSNIAAHYPAKLYAATPMVPHRFVKNSFSKPIGCKICQKTVKKHAFMCEECNMVCHEKCSPDAPFPCTLQNHIRYIPLGLIDDTLPRCLTTSSESDIPTITSPIGSLPTTSTPTPPKRSSRFVKKTKKEDSINSQISMTDSVDSSASAPSSSNMADSSLYGNNIGKPIYMDDNNNKNNNGGKGSGKGRAGKLKKKNDSVLNGVINGKKEDDCVIM